MKEQKRKYWKSKKKRIETKKVEGKKTTKTFNNLNIEGRK